jgi:hypothetical protein
MAPKKSEKILKISNFVLPHYKYTPYGLSSFHTPYITFSLSSSLFYTQHHGELQLDSWVINVGSSFEHPDFVSVTSHISETLMKVITN